MPSIRSALTLAGFVTGLSILTVSPAHAGWFVGGTELKTGSAAIATTAKVEEDLKLNIPVAKIKIDCGVELELIETVIHPDDKILLNVHISRPCKVTEPANCSLSENTIRTQPLQGQLILATSPADRVVWSPKTGKLIAEIPFTEATTCALEGKQPLKGAYTANLPAGQTESASQIFEALGSLENNSLETGSGNKTFVEKGSALLRLTSGSKWSFR